MKKRFYAILFIFLVFHVGLVIPKTKFECSCHISPESFSPCCNCSHCVGQRGGFLSACGCHEGGDNPSERQSTIKRVICFCGSSNSDFAVPGLKYPFLLGDNLFPPPPLEIHPILPMLSALSTQVYVTPLDHPS